MELLRKKLAALRNAIKLPADRKKEIRDELTQMTEADSPKTSEKQSDDPDDSGVSLGNIKEPSSQEEKL